MRLKQLHSPFGLSLAYRSESRPGGSCALLNSIFLTTSSERTSADSTRLFKGTWTTDDTKGWHLLSPITLMEWNDVAE